ncbi:MAG: hypothetical protein L6Q35_00695 [Phycisphaerales bacterium]|nr:hypothetical protein [Phycisphaerales bacterium]
MEGFLKNCKVVRCKNAVAAGTTDITDATGVDTSGFEEVTFLVPFGAITGSAVTSIKAQQSEDDGSSDAYSDLEGSSVTVADDQDNKVAILSIRRPLKKYVKCVVLRATQNSAIDGIIAILRHPRVRPVTQDTTVMAASEELAGPSEGTA